MRDARCTIHRGQYILSLVTPDSLIMQTTNHRSITDSFHLF
jgi:hypothetical protein